MAAKSKKLTTIQLVVLAKACARNIAYRKGTVTSTEVLAELRAQGISVDHVDKRFMGAVFKRGFYRDGWESTGSHGRPVSVWRSLNESNLILGKKEQF